MGSSICGNHLVVNGDALKEAALEFFGASERTELDLRSILVATRAAAKRVGVVTAAALSAANYAFR